MTAWPADAKRISLDAAAAALFEECLSVGAEAVFDFLFF